MSKKTLSAILVAAVLCGVTVMAYRGTQDPAPGSNNAGAAPAVALSFDQAAPVEQRLAALEEALSVERQARQLLQEELVVLTAELENLSANALSTAPDEPSVADASAATANSAAGRQRRGRGNTPAARTERMVEAGFTRSEAERILRRESELQMEQLAARYEARRSGEPISGFGTASQRGQLREELGDDAYERYLTANGRSTRVSVSSVLEGSPALSAGLQPGDEIVRYDGRRVFSMDEITSLQMQGAAGQSVLLDIERDGLLMQVALPRGPLGITGGRRFAR